MKNGGNGMWKYNYNYLSHGLFSWTKKDHKYIDKFKNKVGKWVYVYKDKITKGLKNAKTKVTDALNKSYQKLSSKYEQITKNNRYTTDSRNYNTKVKVIARSKEWQDIVKRQDPEYIYKNSDGNYVYDIDKYMVDKKHPILDIVDDMVNGRPISTNEITVESIIAGADDYVQAGMAYLAIANKVAREAVKYRQGSYKDTEVEKTIKKGMEFLNNTSWDDVSSTFDDAVTSYNNIKVNSQRIQKYAQTIEKFADENGLDVDKVLNGEKVQEYLEENGITESQIRKYL
jgi:hypothetical protein